MAMALSGPVDASSGKLATGVLAKIPAGKTTLIRNVLETANGRRLALLINEFGDIGVDADILRGCGIEARADAIIELA